MKVALVHDDFMQSGGAEHLFATIASFYPSAPIYTSIVDWNKVPKSIEKQRIKTSWMQKIPFAKHFFKALLPFYPLSFESFNLDGCDLVITSTTRFAKGIITKPKTIHVAYLNSTPRFLWDKEILSEYLPRWLTIFINPCLLWLKRWDKACSNKVDFYVANSQNVAEKIKKIYHRDSVVVYPFANTNYFTPAKIHNWDLKSRNYYLVVSRLIKWKKVELAICAAQDLSLNMYVIGEGPDKNRLEKQAKDSKKIVFLGKVTRDKLLEYYRNSQGLIVTQQEDFGIAAVEAQSCGIPVIAYQKGGLCEIIQEGKTGTFFIDQNAELLKDAIECSSRVKWDVSTIRKNALRFSKSVFGKEFKRAIKIACQSQIVSK